MSLRLILWKTCTLLLCSQILVTRYPSNVRKHEFQHLFDLEHDRYCFSFRLMKLSMKQLTRKTYTFLSWNRLLVIYDSESGLCELITLKEHVSNSDKTASANSKTTFYTTSTVIALNGHYHTHSFDLHRCKYAQNLTLIFSFRKTHF